MRTYWFGFGWGLLSVAITHWASPVATASDIATGALVIGVPAIVINLVLAWRK